MFMFMFVCVARWSAARIQVAVRIDSEIHSRLLWASLNDAHREMIDRRVVRMSVKIQRLG